MSQGPGWFKLLENKTKTSVFVCLCPTIHSKENKILLEKPICYCITLLVDDFDHIYTVPSFLPLVGDWFFSFPSDSSLSSGTERDSIHWNTSFL